MPKEFTIQQLRESLVDIAGLEHQQQQLGMDQVSVISGAIDLLTRQYEEEILPGLTSVADDCFFAEEPLAHAGVWGRDVQITGASEPLGPLAGQWSVVRDLQVLQPWLHPNVPPSDPDDSPTITMTVTWNLQFGTP